MQEKNRHSAFEDNYKSITAVYKKLAFLTGKKTFSVLLLCFFLSFCYAIPPVDFFTGVGGKLAFPSASQKEKGGAGAGGGGYLEGGIEFFNIQTELFASVSYLSGGGLVERMLESEIGVGASYVFSKKNARRLPAWLAIRPHIGVFADIYAADVYKSAVQKDEGRLSSAKGVTAGFSPGLFFDFPNLITLKRVKIVPTVGFEESIRFDRVSGIYATPFLNAGVRFFWDAPKKRAEPPKPEERIAEMPEPESPAAEKQMPPEPIYLPFIIFPPDSASLFESPFATPAQKEEWESALNEVAEALTENPDLSMAIIGYANSVTGTAGENAVVLIPLSLKRGEYVRAELEKRGIAPERMTVRADGAGEYSSADGWKNRRVEFLLMKEENAENESF
ncbi:MAG: OmpA family protein [Treponema sp.]